MKKLFDGRYKGYISYIGIQKAKDGWKTVIEIPFSNEKDARTTAEEVKEL